MKKISINMDHCILSGVCLDNFMNTDCCSFLFTSLYILSTLALVVYFTISNYCDKFLFGEKC